MDKDDPSPLARPALRRILTLWPLISYGLAVIVGAGIYVAIGEVMARAGEAAPLSFLLAGIAAALTGLCYAEFGSRFPDAAGAAAYVKQGFGSDRLAQLTGAIMALAAAVGAASIARGAVHYLVVLLPLPVPFLTAVLVVLFTMVAILGVRESVGFAALIGTVEIAGLIVAIVTGLVSAPDFDMTGMLPKHVAEWQGTIAGGFTAFFAFLGFESLTNLAEEVKDPHRTLPLGIVGALTASILLYVAAASAVVLADARGHTPLLDLFKATGAKSFAVIAFLAVANGVLVEIVMLARLFYGMARNGQLPAPLAQIHPRTRTPIVATLLAGILVLTAVLLLPFESLLLTANALTLVVFTLVDLSLWRVHRRRRTSGQVFVLASWVPPVAAAVALALMLAEFLS